MNPVPVEDPNAPNPPPSDDIQPAGRPGRRLSDSERAAMQKTAVQRYNDGASIRTLAAETRRSYGATHRLLTEAGITMRERGSHRRHQPTT